jgi:hypothetical protein
MVPGIARWFQGLPTLVNPVQDFIQNFIQAAISGWFWLIRSLLSGPEHLPSLLRMPTMLAAACTSFTEPALLKL